MTSFRQFLPRSRRAWGLTVAAAVVLTVAWYVGAYPRGMLMAYIDHACGHDEIQTSGYSAGYGWEYGRLLQERYGVRLHAVADCKVWPHERWYVRGYNSVSERLLTKKHGRDIFAECEALALQQWRAEHPDE
jgi:hypothetical protein